MKNILHCILACLISLTVAACLSTPKTPAAAIAATLPEAAVAEPPIAAEEAVKETMPAISGGDTSPAAEMTVLPAESEPAAETAPVAEEAAVQPAETPSVTESDIPVPAGERLLYFYPEPDPLPVDPVKKPEPPAAAAPRAAKVAPTPAPAPAPKETGVPVQKKTEPEKTPEPASAPEEKPAEVIPGIWENEPVAPSVKSETKNGTAVPSRTVTLSAGQTLEVWYPGSGWVYLGDVSAQNGMGYENRRLDKADTLFTFKALKAGNYVLEFNRFDVLADSFLSDTVAVTVSDDGAKKSGKVRAPDYRIPAAAASASAGETAPDAAAIPGTALSGEGKTIAAASGQTGSSVISDEPALVSVPSGPAASGTVDTTAADTAALLEKAKTSLASGDAATALSALESFFSRSSDSLDEAWYLRGQAYEANGPVRDIRKALESYETLVSAWPESSRWNEADARIRYIKQFYFGR